MRVQNPQIQVRAAEPDLPSLDFAIERLDPAALGGIIGAWERLTEVALRNNPFFGPAVLRPALEHMTDVSVSVIAVWAPNRSNPDGDRVLCALFPVVETHIYALPAKTIEIWKHEHCFDATPLVRADCAVEVLEFVLDAIGEACGASLLSLHTVAGDGAFQLALTDALWAADRTVFTRDAFNRACLLPEVDADTYLRAKVSAKTRKNTQRLERRLAEQGELSVVWSAPTDDAESWATDFLALEASGWKGEAASSLASTPSASRFFRSMVAEAMPQGVLTMMRISLDDRPIAIACDLRQGGHAAYFKTSYDEAFGEYSPGLICELHNLERLHQAGVEWMDSCATSDHSMINRIWPDRVRYQSLVVGVGGRAARALAAALPLMQALHNTARDIRTRKETP